MQSVPEIGQLVIVRKRPFVVIEIAPAAAGISPIVDYYLHAHPGWHSKEAILSGTAFPENRWNAAMRELLDSGQVQRQGEKRGAKYQATPSDSDA